MKQPFLRAMQLFAVAFVLFIAPSCKKQSSLPTEDLATNKTNNTAKINSIADLTTVNPFNKKVGAPVDGQLGDRWIANYKAKYGYNKSCTLNNAYLQSLINKPNCVGISLCYAKNPLNNTLIFPIGVDLNGKMMKCESIPCAFGNISWATAQLWIANDKGSIKSHFLGSNTFYRLNENACKIQNIRVDYAIDGNNQQHLLLSNPCVLNLVKQYEDQDIPCPKWCPSN